MKKTLLATALAVGFAGAAAAQTSVTLYGIVDGGFGYTQFKDKNATGAEPSKATRTGLYDGNQQGNRWGLRGSEDLGGGLKASFQLESGFSLATGGSQQGSRLFGRTAKLAVGSDSWGEVAFGRQLNFASRYVAGVVGVYDDAFQEGHIGATFTSTGTVRYDNMVTYETPSFSGFRFGLGYSFNVDGGQPYDINRVQDRDITAFSTALSYTNGPLTVAASYDQLNAPDADVVVTPTANPITGVVTNVTTIVPNTDGDVKSWALGVSYDFDVVKLHVGFGQDRKGVFAARGVNFGDGLASTAQGFGFVDRDYKTNNYALGVAVPLDSSSIAFNWQSARLGSGAYKDTNRTNGGKNSQNLYSVVYTYDLSKRTNLYAFGTYGTGYAFDNVTVTQAVVGLRHRF